MTPPSRYSASPLPSFATRPPYAARPPTFAESLRALIEWLRPRRRPVTLKEQIKVARLVDQIAAELAEADAAVIDEDRKASKSKPKVKR